MMPPFHSEYVIGIGSQRAGTTLLHQVLKTSTNIAMHPVKELHYFDSECGFRPADALLRQAGRQLKQELRQLARHPSRDRLIAIETTYQLCRKPLGSYSYRSLFKRIEGKTPLIGEITPEYMLLPLPRIAEMRASVGDARIVLIKRDPLQRVVSALKLFLTSVQRGNGRISNRQKDAICLDVITTKKAWVEVQKQFNDYPLAVQNYAQYFPRMLIMDYQDFAVRNTQYETLQDFLGVKLSRSDYDRCIGQVVNAFDRDYTVSREVLSAIREAFCL